MRNLKSIIRVVNWTVSAASAIAIAFLGHSAAQSMSTTWCQEVRQADSVENKPLPLLPPPIVVGDGTWTIAGLPFSVTTQVVSDHETRTFLSRLPTIVTSHRNASPGERELVRKFARLATSHEVHNGLHVYHIEKPTLLGCVFVVERSGQANLLGGRIAYPRRKGEWTVVEAIYRDDAMSEQSTIPNLLPMRRTATTVARRHDLDGNLRAHIVSITDDIDDLAHSWADAGWALRRQPRRGKNAYLAHRDGLDLYVNQAPETGEGRKLLFIINTTSLPLAKERTES